MAASFPFGVDKDNDRCGHRSPEQPIERHIASPSGVMRGKRGLVMGLANNRSIAWGIAKAARQAGAEIALTYQGEALERRVRPLAAELDAHVVGECDVTDAASIDAVFAEVEKLWGELDFVVHCIAFSDKDELTGRYVDTSEENFKTSLLISCYSFTAVAQRAEKLMKNGGSLLTLTYYGAEKWMPHYNVMGVAKAALEASVRYLAADLGEKNIRVNAISAGPIKTLAASGIGDFRYILKWNEYNAPLRRTVTIEEVGESAVFLLSPMARGVTGEILHVDAGYHVVGMKNPHAPDIAEISEKSLTAPMAAGSGAAPVFPAAWRDRLECRRAAARAARTFRSMRWGAQQAERAGRKLKKILASRGRDSADDLAFQCSPLLRPRQTLEIAPRRNGPAARRGGAFDDRLIEFTFGRWEGPDLAGGLRRRSRTGPGARGRQMEFHSARRRKLCAADAAARTLAGGTGRRRMSWCPMAASPAR